MASDSPNTPFYQQIILVISGVIMTAIVGSFLSIVRSKGKEYRQLTKKVDENRRWIILLRKALILKAQMTDDQIKHDHPSEFHEYEKIMKEILSDIEDD